MAYLSLPNGVEIIHSKFKPTWGRFQLSEQHTQHAERLLYSLRVESIVISLHVNFDGKRSLIMLKKILSQEL